MKKIITSVALMLATAAISIAQTTATNWTATDCSSTSHTLFNELDNGKVIVFSWVMPCSSCINPSKTAYNIVQSYATSHPGKVLFYIADDLGNSNCTALSNWVTTNNIGNTNNMTIFSNSGNVINENNFGGSGMPHIVVMGAMDHKIYFNEMNNNANDATGIQNAINAAIGATSVANINSQISFSVSPNPVTEYCSVNYANPVKKITITSINGQLIKEEVFTNGKINPSINISEVANGMYIIKVTDADNKTGIQKIVKQ